jgi:hypothetical protein
MPAAALPAPARPGAVPRAEATAVVVRRAAGGGSRREAAAVGAQAWPWMLARRACPVDAVDGEGGHLPAMVCPSTSVIIIR